MSVPKFHIDSGARGSGHHCVASRALGDTVYNAAQYTAHADVIPNWCPKCVADPRLPLLMLAITEL